MEHTPVSREGIYQSTLTIGAVDIATLLCLRPFTATCQWRALFGPPVPPQATDFGRDMDAGYKNVELCDASIPQKAGLSTAIA
jgi:hypothetical protein